MLDRMDEGLMLSRLLELDRYFEKTEEARLYIIELCKLRNDQLKMLAQFFTGAGITLLLSLFLSTIKCDPGDPGPDQFALVVAFATGFAALGVGALLYIRLCRSTYAFVDAFRALEEFKAANRKLR